MLQSHANPPRFRPQEGSNAQAETDLAFLERQFRSSIAALERVNALEPGEFDELANTPVYTDAERAWRTARHEQIARRALSAVQQGLLSEEDFNIWSGRRKEHGQPVKVRFEQAYESASTPAISRLRGTLTGIVRSYLRLLDALIAELMSEGGAATTPEALLLVEYRAVDLGLLQFEPFTQEMHAGWPCYLRSTGRFRGAARLREFFEQRQSELPIRPELTRHMIDELRLRGVNVPPLALPQPERTLSGLHNPWRRMLHRVAQLFQLTP